MKVERTSSSPVDVMPEPSETVGSMTGTILRNLLRKMQSHLQTGLYSDLKIICDGYTFHVHRLAVAANCVSFGDSLSNTANGKEDEIVLNDEYPDLIARLVYFLYTGAYPVTHIARLGIKCFEGLPDTYVVLGRLDLLHAKMYHVGTRFGVPELVWTASQAFRSLGHDGFCSQPDWKLAAYTIYNSTPSEYRDLRNIVVREMLYTRTFNSQLLDVSDWKLVFDKIPELAADLATITLSTDKFRCDKCEHAQYVLIQPCSQKAVHGANECVCSSLAEQECRKCHEVGVFEESSSGEANSDMDSDAECNEPECGDTVSQSGEDQPQGKQSRDITKKRLTRRVHHQQNSERSYV